MIRSQGCVDTADKMILEDEVEDATDLPQLNLLLIEKADVSGYVGVDCLDLHIHVDHPGGTVITHEPHQIFLNLLEGNIVGLQEEIEDILQIGLPEIFPGNSSWVQIDSYVSQGGDAHDRVKAKLCCAVPEEVDKDVGVGHGAGGQFPPFCLLRDQSPLNFSVL